MEKYRKVNLSTSEIKSVLKAFDIPQGEEYLGCARLVPNGEPCFGGSSYDISEVISSDNELINLYCCNECQGLSYQIIKDADYEDFEEHYLNKDIYDELLKAFKAFDEGEIQDIIIAINAMFTKKYAEKLAKPFRILQKNN